MSVPPPGNPPRPGEGSDPQTPDPNGTSAQPPISPGTMINGVPVSGAAPPSGSGYSAPSNWPGGVPAPGAYPAGQGQQPYPTGQPAYPTGPQSPASPYGQPNNPPSGQGQPPQPPASGQGYPQQPLAGPAVPGAASAQQPPSGYPGQPQNPYQNQPPYQDQHQYQNQAPAAPQYEAEQDPPPESLARGMARGAGRWLRGLLGTALVLALLGGGYWWFVGQHAATNAEVGECLTGEARAEDMKKIDCADPKATYRLNEVRDGKLECDPEEISYTSVRSRGGGTTWTGCLTYNVKADDCIELAASNSDDEFKVDCAATVGQPQVFRITYTSQTSSDINLCPEGTTGAISLTTRNQLICTAENV